MSENSSVSSHDSVENKDQTNETVNESGQEARTVNDALQERIKALQRQIELLKGTNNASQEITAKDSQPKDEIKADIPNELPDKSEIADSNHPNDSLQTNSLDAGMDTQKSMKPENNPDIIQENSVNDNQNQAIETNTSSTTVLLQNDDIKPAEPENPNENHEMIQKESHNDEHESIKDDSVPLQPNENINEPKIDEVPSEAGKLGTISHIDNVATTNEQDQGDVQDNDQKDKIITVPEESPDEKENENHEQRTNEKNTETTDTKVESIKIDEDAIDEQLHEVIAKNIAPPSREEFASVSQMNIVFHAIKEGTSVMREILENLRQANQILRQRVQV